MSNTHKIMRIFTQACVDSDSVEEGESSLNILRRAETENKMIRYKKDIHCCAYKTTLQDKPAIIMIYSMLLPGPLNGSSASSEIVMDLVGLLEKVLMPIDKIKFTRDIEGSRKNIAVLKVIKILKEENVL